MTCKITFLARIRPGYYHLLHSLDNIFEGKSDVNPETIASFRPWKGAVWSKLWLKWQQRCEFAPIGWICVEVGFLKSQSVCLPQERSLVTFYQGDGAAVPVDRGRDSTRTHMRWLDSQEQSMERARSQQTASVCNVELNPHTAVCHYLISQNDGIMYSHWVLLLDSIEVDLCTRCLFGLLDPHLATNSRPADIFIL